jgi:hypothetical protein
MRNQRVLIALILFVVIFSAACQTSPTTPTQPAYPAYPGFNPGIYPEAVSGGGLYPGYADGAIITWEHAIAMVLNGEVASVTQDHQLNVILTLNDGRTLTTTEPAIDEIINVIRSCGDPCKDITIATE